MLPPSSMLPVQRLLGCTCTRFLRLRSKKSQAPSGSVAQWHERRAAALTRLASTAVDPCTVGGSDRRRGCREERHQEGARVSRHRGHPIVHVKRDQSSRDARGARRTLGSDACGRAAAAFEVDSECSPPITAPFPHVFSLDDSFAKVLRRDDRTYEGQSFSVTLN